MSRSPARAASVSSHTRKPSGSSVAIEPASRSCASGTRSRTIRNASITPTGSFHGSNRLTWHTIGRCTSTPYWRASSWQNGIASSRFLTDSGSMHGGACTTRAMSSDAGTNSGIVHTDASYASTNGRKNSHTVGLASVRSMWQRQIHVVFFSLRAEPVAQEAQDRRRLGVVHHDEVVLAVEEQRVVEDLLEVDLLHLLRPVEIRALQRVVDALGDAEEEVAALHDLPVGVEADAAEQRDVGGEQLGHPAAVGRGVEVQDPSALAAARPGAGFDRRRRRPTAPGVLGQVLFEEGHALEQGALPSRARAAAEGAPDWSVRQSID